MKIIPNRLRNLSIIAIIALSSLTAVADERSDDITKLYTATFERIPDKAGLEFWIDSNLSIDEIASSFFDQNETKMKYPEDAPTSEFVNSIYQNLFDRSSDEEGLDYWSNAIEQKKIARSKFILAVTNGAQGSDEEILNEKRDISKEYLARLEYDKNDAESVMEIYHEEGHNRALDLIINLDENEVEHESERESLESRLNSITLTPEEKDQIRKEHTKHGIDSAEKLLGDFEKNTQSSEHEDSTTEQNRDDNNHKEGSHNSTENQGKVYAIGY